MWLSCDSQEVSLRCHVTAKRSPSDVMCPIMWLGQPSCDWPLVIMWLSSRGQKDLLSHRCLCGSGKQLGSQNYFHKNGYVLKGPSWTNFLNFFINTLTDIQTNNYHNTLRKGKKKYLQMLCKLCSLDKQQIIWKHTCQELSNEYGV